MFRDTLGKIMFNTGRNYLKHVRRARILHSPSNSQKYTSLKQSEVSIPKKSELKTLPIFQYPISQEDTRRVYVWGLAEHGALGETGALQKNKISYLSKPKRVSFAERHKVTDITCGYGFTVYAVHSSDKNLFMEPE